MTRPCTRACKRYGLCDCDKVEGTTYPVRFDPDADCWPRGGIVSVWINTRWHDPREVLSFKVCEALDRAADAWRPE